MDLFFDHYFNFLSAKTKINKIKLNLINLDGLEALKRQIYGTGLGVILRFIYIFEAALLYFSIVAVFWNL